MNKVRAGVLTIFVILMTGCGGLPSKIDPPSVSLSGLNIVDVGLLEQTFGLKLRVQNPNAFDIPIHGLNYRIDLNGKEIAHGVNDQSVTLPSLGEEILEVQAVTSANNVLQQLNEMWSTGVQTVDYRVRGNLRAGGGLGRIVPVPFDQSGKVDLAPLLNLGRRAAPAKSY